VKRINIKETANIGGNIASITGISLLWLQSFYPAVNVLIAIPILVIVALLAIGLSALTWFFFTLGYQRFAIPSSTRSGNVAAQIAYAGLAGSALLVLLLMVLSLIYSLAFTAFRDFSAYWFPGR
jgi:hypothetical protein